MTLSRAAIHYHFRGLGIRGLAVLLRKPKHTNFAMTLGSHCFVRFGFISGPHRAHEFYHSLEAHRKGFGRWLWEYVRDLLRHGYRQHPEERAADDYAQAHASEFTALGKAS